MMSYINTMTNALANVLESISAEINNKSATTEFNPTEFDEIEYLDQIWIWDMSTWTSKISFASILDSETRLQYNRCNRKDFHVFVNVHKSEKVDYPYNNYQKYLEYQINYYELSISESVLKKYFEHASYRDTKNLIRFISHANDSIKFFKAKLEEAKDKSNYGKAYIVDSLNLAVKELTTSRDEASLICYDYLEKEFQKRGVDKYVVYIEVPMISYTDGTHIRMYLNKDIEALNTLTDFGCNIKLKDFVDNGHLKYVPVLYGNKPFPNTKEVNTNIFNGYVPLSPKNENGVLDAYLYLGLDDCEIIEELNSTIPHDKINLEDIKLHPTIFHIF